MRYNIIFTIFILLIFQGCRDYIILQPNQIKPKTTVVLLKNKKRHNAVVISTDQGSQRLERVRAYSDLTQDDRPPTSPKIMSKEELKRRMGELASISIKHPISYFFYFKKGTMELTPSSQKRIDKAITSIIERVPCMVDVIGHTERRGIQEENIQTSYQQALYLESILKKEILKRITYKKDITLTTKGYGEEDLLIPTPNNREEEKNRNVEVFIK